jgi:small subunit ribosomal protein S17
MSEEKQGNRRTIVGVVVSNAMDKTIVVRSETLVKHRYFRNIFAGTLNTGPRAENQCQVGDKVLLVESRPLTGTNAGGCGRSWKRRNRGDVL